MAPAQSPDQLFGPGSLNALIPAAMAEWEVPGLAIAVVKNGRVVMLRGFGLRDVERKLRVTPETLFALGSITKSFTVTGLGILADGGHLDWDAPVRTLLPDFRLHGAGLTAKVTVRDLLVHRTGLPRHDALWYVEVFDRRELVRRLRFLEPAAALGKVFAYNNLMYVVAGQLAGRLGGGSWEYIMRRGLIDPLGMKETRLSLALFRAAIDYAVPYFPGKSGRIRIPARDTGPIAPAASVYANARETARFVALHIGRGEFEGRRIIARATAKAMHTPRIDVPEPALFPELGPLRYGMAFYVTTYRGRTLVYHPGVIDGYSAMFSFLPEAGLGIIVLTNLSGRNPVPALVTYAAYDHFMGLAALPWIVRFREINPSSARGRGDAQDRPATVRSRPLTAYAGSYDHPAYGRIRIEARKTGRLEGHLHNIRFALRYLGEDRWEVPKMAWPLREGLAMRFAFDGGDKAQRLLSPLADGPTYRLQAGDLVFHRSNAP